MYVSYEHYRVVYYVAKCGNVTQAESHPRDQNAGGGAWLHAVFTEQSRYAADHGGSAAV